MSDINSLAIRPGLGAIEPLVCLMSPSRADDWDLVPVNYSNYRPAPAKLEAELLGGVWSLNPLNGNAI